MEMAVASTEERPSQHQQTQEEEDTAVVVSSATASFDSLNDDCLVQILSYLPTVDLNSNVAFCSQRFREARNHESLDQTRTATIVLSKGSTVVSLCTAIASNGWNERLQGNYTCLKIVGVHKLQYTSNVRHREELRQMIIESHQLTGITSLDLTCNPNTESQLVGHRYVGSLSLLFPNLREVDLSYWRELPYFVCENFCEDCPNLTRLTWNECKESHPIHGTQFKSGAHLTEVNLDNSHFRVSSNPFGMQVYSNLDVGVYYVFRDAQRLQCLSIKNATWNYSNNDEVMPVSQEMLIKMVRHHPALRWLRSDLSEANITMLKQERPQVTLSVSKAAFDHYHSSK